MSEKYRPIIKPGTHLAPSKETDGAVRGALLDNETNQVRGQAEWEPIVEEREKSDLLTNLGIAIGSLLVGIAIDKASPHVKRWLENTAIPYAKKTWSKLTGKEDKQQTTHMNKNHRADTTGITIGNRLTPIEFSKVIDDTLEDYDENMSSEEAQRHLINMCLTVLRSLEIRSLFLRESALSDAKIQGNPSISDSVNTP